MFGATGIAMGSRASIAQLLGQGIIDLLAPDRCLGCRRRASPLWCHDCAGQVGAVPSPCRRCAASRNAGHPCWPATSPVDITVAAFDYTGPIAAAIRTAKLGGAWSGWHIMGSQLAQTAAPVAVDIDVVTWVTTSQRRARRRGFDHAQMLAEAVGQALGLPCVQLLDVMAGRRGDVFGITSQRRLPGTHVLLVDDVLTTGMTASGAAQALKSAGAGTVTLGVVARAGRHDLHVAGSSR